MKHSTTTLQMKLFRLLVLAGLVAGVAACGDNDLSLSKAAGTNDETLDSEQLRKRQMQTVRIQDKSTGQWLEKTYDQIVNHENAYSVRGALTEQCATDSNLTAMFGTNACSPATLIKTTCAAKRLLGVIRQPGASLEYQGKVSTASGDVTHTFLLPTQSSSANVTLASAARAWLILTLSGELSKWRSIAQGTATSCTAAIMETVVTVPGGGLQNVGQASSSAVLEGIALLRELGEQLAHSNLSVADAELSSTQSLKTATARAVSAPELSRAAAIHQLVGGDSGLPGLVGNGLCQAPPLTPQAQRALDLIREAAPSPASVNTLNDTSVFVNTATDSIKARLARYWGRTFKNDLHIETGLRLEDFEEARQYLREELRVYSRSTTQTFGTDTTMPRYAATRNPPEPRDPAYWAALARYEANPHMPSTSTDPNAYNLSLVIQGTQTGWIIFSSALVNTLHLLTGDLSIILKGDARFTNATQRAWLDGFAQLAADLNNEFQGYVHVRWPISSTDSRTSFEVASHAGTTRLVVKGDDGLQCAVEGRIEGAPCTSAQLTAATVCTLASGTKTCNVTAADWNTRIYVVKLRGGATAAPGSYESLSGFPLPAIQAGRPFARRVPVAPSFDRRVAEIIAPAPSWCAKPRLSCAGANFDERLPLENELASNGDAVESSWSHYLELARNAAKEADALGEAYIVTALDKTVREETVEIRQQEREAEVERIMSELQDICGTAVDPMSLLKALSGTTKDNDFASMRQKNGTGAGITCSADSACSTSAGFRCIAGVCLKDPTQVYASLPQSDPLRPALSRIAECIGSDTTTPLVSLGDRPICVWHATDNPTQICQNSNVNTTPCPVLASWQNDNPATTTTDEAGWICNIKKPTPEANYTTKLITDTLGYFSVVDEDPLPDLTDPSVPESLCYVLNEASKSSSKYTADVANAIKSSEVFNPLNLVQIAARIGWGATIGGTSAITLDGKSLYDTYSPMFRDATRTLNWCASFNNCASEDDRARLNDRMMRAVVALRGTTVGDLSRVYLPFYIANYTALGAAVGDWNTTFPGTNTPIRVRQYEAGAFGPLRPVNSSPATIHVFETNSTTPPANAWRAVRDGVMTAQGMTLNANSLTYQFAIGDAGMFTDSYGYGAKTKAGEVSFPNYRFDYWYGVSTAALSPVPGNMSALLAGGTQTMPWTWSPSLLPGAPYDANPNDSCDDDSWFDDAVDWVVKHGAYMAHPYSAAYDAISSYMSGAVPEQEKGKVTLPATCATNSQAQLMFKGKVECGGKCRYNVMPAVDPFTYERQSMLDAMNLVCAVQRDPLASRCDPTRPPYIDSPRDLNKASSFLRCAADQLNRRAALSPLTNFPKRAVDALRKESVVGSYPAVGGQIGTAVSELRASLVALADIGPQITAQLRALGNDLDTMKNAIEMGDVQDRIADVQFQQAFNNQTTACATALAGSATVDLAALAGNAAAAMLTCANSFAQIRLAGRLEGLSQDANAIAVNQSLVEFRQQFDNRAMALHGLATQMGEALENIDAQLSAIEGVRMRAQRALAAAMHKASAVAEKEAEVNAAYNTREGLARERYARAQNNAIRLAFLAKRAIEARLGVKLAELTEDLPLVAAPASWEGTVCTSTGVDFNRMKEEGTFDGAQFADQFIGEYVQKLANTIESYRLEYDFHEGQDTAVISLREDVFGVKKPCHLPGKNLFYYSGDLQEPANAQGVQGWTRSPCTGGVCEYARVDPEPLGMRTADPDLLKAHALRTKWVSGTTSAPWVAQKVYLEPGTYIVSWHRPFDASLYVDAEVKNSAGQVVDDSGVWADIEDQWERVRRIYHLSKADTYTFTFYTPAFPGSSNIDAYFSAPMLERITERGRTTASAYQNTTHKITRLYDSCADTNGEIFRTERYWRRHCLKLCDNGLSATCDNQNATKHCYKEATFNINQRDLEAGKLFNYGGFAKGNFNYRLEDIGVNFVGTGLVDCKLGGDQACYGKGNLQYSLKHMGPYIVRNHMGRDARIELFEGNIEHARGLAIERYLTNPIASADADLISQYFRTELRGRPLDGNFALRVWEDEGVDFDAIEDVQIVLKYRYWTRFD